jgi:hypothetical protein
MTAQLAPEETQAITTAQPAVPVRTGWPRRAWHAICKAVAGFHSDARRAIEVQMPWGVDDQWHTR